MGSCQTGIDTQINPLDFIYRVSSCCGSIFKSISQGPLKKWTEHSQELHLLKIHCRGAPITPRGWMGVDFLDHELL